MPSGEDMFVADVLSGRHRERQIRRDAEEEHQDKIDELEAEIERLNTVLTEREELAPHWISVNDWLPEIPDGQYSVTVLIASHDPIFDELKGHIVYKVYDCSFGPLPEYGIEEPLFKTVGYGHQGDVSWHPIVDIVTHWMPLPEPPEGVNVHVE